MDETFEKIAALLEFPADFPIKVMGRCTEGFAQAIAAVVIQHVPDFDVDTLVITPSSKGTFLSLTVPVTVQSGEQLQALYQALAAHPMVRIVL